MGGRRKTKSSGGGCGCLILIVVVIYVIAHLPAGDNRPPAVVLPQVAGPGPSPAPQAMPTSPPEFTEARHAPAPPAHREAHAARPEPSPGTRPQIPDEARQKARAIDRQYQAIFEMERMLAPQQEPSVGISPRAGGSHLCGATCLDGHSCMRRVAGPGYCYQHRE